jgi:transcriptional regulator with XRE-family HTH domain
MGAEIPIGERVRFYRDARGLSQKRVATFARISVDYLSMVERGVKTPRVDVLYRIANVLRVPIAVFFTEPELGEDGRLSADAIGRAMTAIGRMEAPDAPPDLQQLRSQVAGAWEAWQETGARFTAACALLPDVILEAERAVRAFPLPADAGRRQEANRIAADLYLLVRQVCKFMHRNDLAVLAADRGLRCVEAADDPVRMAAARWNLSKALLTSGQPEEAEEVALKGMEDLAPRVRVGDVDALAMHGGLNLAASLAEVRVGDPWTARRRVREEAASIADQTGEVNPAWTVFGPANVQIHSVVVDTEAGDLDRALDTASDLAFDTIPTVERRASHLLTVAECYEQRHEDIAVLHTLLTLERQAPEDLRYRASARTLARSLVKRARPTLSPDARALAARIGVN